MRIALIIEQFNPAAGGRERSTQQIARRLITRGHTVTVLTNTVAGDPHELLPGARFVVAGGMRTKYALGLARFARWAQRQLDEQRFDASLSVTIAVPADLVQPREGSAAEMLARKLEMDGRRPLGVLKQLATRTRCKNLAWLAMERRTLASPRLKRLVAISDYVRAQFIAHHQFDESRIALIPNAAEVEAAPQAQRDADRQALRQELGIDAAHTAFLFVSTEAHRKGLAQLLAAFAMLHRDQPDARLIIAGLTDAWPRRLIRRIGIEDMVRWVGRTNQIDRCYRAADVTVLPTWYDPASKVVLESLLHGVPAISTLTNGSSQWVYSPTGEHRTPSPFDGDATDIIRSPHPQAGRVIDSPANIPALTQAMRELCDADERARCAATTQSVGRFITMDAHVDQLEKLLTEVAGQSAASG